MCWRILCGFLLCLCLLAIRQPANAQETPSRWTFSLSTASLGSVSDRIATTYQYRADYNYFPNPSEATRIEFPYSTVRRDIILTTPDTRSILASVSYKFSGFDVSAQFWSNSSETPLFNDVMMPGTGILYTTDGTTSPSSLRYNAVEVFGLAHYGLRNIKHDGNMSPIWYGGRLAYKTSSLTLAVGRTIGSTRIFLGARFISSERWLELYERQWAYTHIQMGNSTAIWDNRIRVASRTEVKYGGIAPTAGISGNVGLPFMLNLSGSLSLSILNTKAKERGVWTDVDDVRVRWTDPNTKELLNVDPGIIIYTGEDRLSRERNVLVTNIEGSLGISYPVTRFAKLGVTYFASVWFDAPQPSKLIIPEWIVAGTSEWTTRSKTLFFGGFGLHAEISI